MIKYDLHNTVSGDIHKKLKKHLPGFSRRAGFIYCAHPSKKTQQVLAKLLLVPDMVSGRGHFAPAQHDTKYKTSTKPGFPLGTIKKLYIPVLVTPRPTSGGLCHKDSKIWTTPNARTLHRARAARATGLCRLNKFVGEMLLCLFAKPPSRLCDR